MATKRELEAKLSLKKQKAALMLVEQELGDEFATMKTQEEIADELGVSRMTLYRWRTQDEDFINYMNLISSAFLKSQTATVFKQLMKSIKGAQPSIKGIELFAKINDLLKDTTNVEVVIAERSSEAIEKSLAELDALVDSDDEPDFEISDEEIDEYFDEE